MFIIQLFNTLMNMKIYLILVPVLLFSILTGCKPDVADGIPPDIEPQLRCTNKISNDLYPCHNVDLAAHLPPDSLKGDRLNDIWGWTDSETGAEYAIIGLSDGVSFVDISDPVNPVVVGKLVETSAASKPVASSKIHSSGNHLQHEEEKSHWRDFKVYNDYLFVVSDNQPDSISHGMQVFDLTSLREVTVPDKEYTEDALYSGFENAHNIAINEETGYAYVVGSDTYGGGLHIVDIQNPLEPKFAGFHADTTVGRNSTGYVHDTQCVVYRGPDADYQGNEVCFNSSETHLVIANVTNKKSTFTIAKKSYSGNKYAHQGWLTEDHRYFLLDDEDDERKTGSNTRTYIWDVRDLDNPEVIGVHNAGNGAIDHNQYIKDGRVYQANYTSGLRILSLDEVASGKLLEIAYFDTHPENNQADFKGAWSTYPFFGSGVIIVSDITKGLFILWPTVE